MFTTCEECGAEAGDFGMCQRCSNTMDARSDALQAENAELLYYLRWLTCGVDECWATIPEHASGIAKVEQLTGMKIDKDSDA